MSRLLWDKEYLTPAEYDQLKLDVDARAVAVLTERYGAYYTGSAS
ncbi:MAG TPA: hypothetical protein VK983_01020 [Candidatus Limnocylindrales bacterium]|nr:hypothetical protein [Candidatus Limnocylindrales bacterium]